MQALSEIKNIIEWETNHDLEENGCDCDELGDCIASATGDDPIFMKNLKDKMNEMQQMENKEAENQQIDVGDADTMVVDNGSVSGDFYDLQNYDD